MAHAFAAIRSFGPIGYFAVFKILFNSMRVEMLTLQGLRPSRRYTSFCLSIIHLAMLACRKLSSKMHSIFQKTL